MNSRHHQAAAQIGTGLRVSVRDREDDTVEGLERRDKRFVVAVQWHPEDMPGESSASAIFGAFVEAARRYAAEKQQAGELSPAGVSRSE